MSSIQEKTESNGKKTGAPEKKVRKAPKVLGRIIIVLAIIGGLGYGVYWWIDNVAYVSTDDAAIDGRQVKLSSKMLGRIETEKVAEGQSVKSGQIVVTIEEKDLKAQEAQAVASLAYAQQNLTLAQVNLDKSQSDFERSKKLFDGGAATKESFDHAQKALDASNAQYEVAKASVATSSAQLGVIEAQLLNIKITSPIDGTIDKISLYPGDLAQPGQTILTINNLGDLWVTANFEETKVGSIRAGASVRVNVDTYSGHVFKGKVEMVGAGIVPSAFQIGDFTKTTQRIPVKIRIENQAGFNLVPGMSVEVKVRTPSAVPDVARRLFDID